jgi:hypothetical protein
MLDPGTGARYFARVYATKPYRDCVAVQRVIMARIATGDVEDKTLAALARALCDLEETKRKLKMKPLPKPVDVSTRARPQAAPQATWSEPEPKESLSSPTVPAPCPPKGE